jgi:hypothetical protein
MKRATRIAIAVAAAVLLIVLPWLDAGVYLGSRNETLKLVDPGNRLDVAIAGVWSFYEMSADLPPAMQTVGRGSISRAVVERQTDKCSAMESTAPLSTMPTSSISPRLSTAHRSAIARANAIFCSISNIAVPFDSRSWRNTCAMRSIDQQARPHHEGARDDEHLLLAARQGACLLRKSAFYVGFCQWPTRPSQISSHLFLYFCPMTK